MVNAEILFICWWNNIKTGNPVFIGNNIIQVIKILKGYKTYFV